MMSMMDDKKKAVTAILGVSNLKPESKEKGEKSSGNSSNELGQEIIKAIESKDSKKVAAAFKAMFYHCMNENSEDEY
jgi:hypothetical protein